MSLYDEAFPNGEFGFDPTTVYSQLKSTVNTAQEAIAQGNIIFDAAKSAHGGYGVRAVRAQQAVSGQSKADAGDVAGKIGAGIASGIAIGTAVASATGGTALALAAVEVGALIGTAIPVPVIGTAVGAAVGALVGACIAIAEDWNDIEGLFTGKDDPSQTDYRFASDRACFVPAPNGTPFGVIPGFMRWNPRCSPNSVFYQTPDGPNAGPTRPFSFVVTWKGVKKSTDHSRDMAWKLAQYLTVRFSSQLGHKAPTQDLWMPLLAAFMGDEKKVRKAMRKAERWYGGPGAFVAAIPYAATGGNPPNIDNTTANVLATMAEFEKFPLDYLYYPVMSDYNHSIKLFTPTALQAATDVMVSADTSFLRICEHAALDSFDEEVFHDFIWLSHLWHEGRVRDAKVYQGLRVGNHPNFSRILGIISARLVKKQRRNASLARKGGLLNIPAFVSAAEYRAKVASAGGTASINAKRTQGFSAPATRQLGANRASIVSSSKTPAQSDNLVKWLGAATLAVGAALLVRRSSKKRED